MPEEQTAKHPPRSVSIILPAYNEEEELSNTVSSLQGWIEDRDEDTISSVEVILVEDGCTDDTPQIAEELTERYDNVTHIHFPERLGKGQAITEGFTAADGELLCFMDVDRSTDPDSLNDLLRPLYTNEADITIGSRYADDSSADRHRTRDIMSRTYNTLTRKTLHTDVRDHQCGFKAMQNDVFHALTDEISAQKWFWDTELLFRAGQHDFRVQEVPITWEADDDSAVNAARVGAELFGGLLRLKGEELLGSRYDSTAKYVRFAVVGGFGAILNTIVLYMLTDIFGLYYLLSAAVAIETAIVTMFFLNNWFTFDNGKSGLGRIVDGIMRSNLVRAVGIGVQLGTLYALTEFVGIYYLVSNIVAIFIASIFNFFGEKRFNWKE